MSLSPGFLRDESGAITVDWVVLTAAVVMLASSVGTILNSGGESSISGRLQQIISNAVDGVGAAGE